MKPRIVTYNVLGLMLLAVVVVFMYVNMRVVAYWTIGVLAALLLLRSGILELLKLVGVGR